MIDPHTLLTRPQLDTIAATLTDDQLREAVRRVSQGATTPVAPFGLPGVPGAPKAPAAPVVKAPATLMAKAPAAPVQAPAAPVAKVAKAALPQSSAQATPEAFAMAIASMAPSGFAKGELAAVFGLDPKSSSLNTAISTAVKAGSLASAGEKRFARYGATAAVAQARSDGDRSSGTK